MIPTRIRGGAAVASLLILSAGLFRAFAKNNDTITADFSTPEVYQQPIGRALSSVHRDSAFGTNTWEHLDALGLQQVRVWMHFNRMYDITNRASNYSYYYQYLDDWQRVTDALYVNWLPDYRFVMKPDSGWTTADYETAMTDAMAHFKKRYPKIQFIECDNEPDVSPTGMTNYYASYKIVYHAVNAVNAMHLPGSVLQVGGPTTCSFKSREIQNFLNDYAADNDPGKKLDFVAYHQYLFGGKSPYDNKDNPALVGNERATLDGWLAARKLASRPVYISEMGIFPIDRASVLGLSADFHLQAAGMAALFYYYSNQREIIPFNWTINHPQNARKNMFVDTTNGVPRPYYLMQQMCSMLPKTRYPCTTLLTDRGLGIGALAGGTSNRVAVMTWNYQWTNSTEFNVTLALNHLPSAFEKQRVRVESYLVDTNFESGELPNVEENVLKPIAGRVFRKTFQYEPNALRLTVLTALDKK
jgi:hypothetical protein